MGDSGREGSPQAKRRFVVPALSQSSAIGAAQERRGTLLFGSATATSGESTSADVTRHSRQHNAALPPSGRQSRHLSASSRRRTGPSGVAPLVNLGDKPTDKILPTTIDIVESDDDDPQDTDETETAATLASTTTESGTSVSNRSPAAGPPAARSATAGVATSATAECASRRLATASSVPASSDSSISTANAVTGPERATAAPAVPSTAAAPVVAAAAAPVVAAAAAAAAVQKTKSSLSILVNPVQRHNPILPLIRNVPHEFDDSIIPDYVIGEKACALFLSLRYHLLHPEYIYDRLKRLGRRYELRVLLVHVDMKDCQTCLQQLTSISILAECTLVLAWSYGEAARYLETYKAYEKKPADLLKERVAGDYASRLSDCLTTLRFVNKANVSTLSSSFGSLDKIIRASPQALALCPGFGANKANRLHKFFRQPFMTGSGRARAWHASPAAAAGGRGRARHAARGRGAGSLAAIVRMQGSTASASSSITATATAATGSGGGGDYDYDDDDVELAPELEALMDVVDVYDELDGLDDDDATLWGDV